MNGIDSTSLAFSIAESARVTGTTEGTITEAIRDGRLTARHAARRVIVARQDLEDWLRGLPATRGKGS